MQSCKTALGVREPVLEHEPVWRLGHDQEHNYETDGGCCEADVQRHAPASVVQHVGAPGFVCAPGDEGADERAECYYRAVSVYDFDYI